MGSRPVSPAALSDWSRSRHEVHAPHALCSGTRSANPTSHDTVRPSALRAVDGARRSSSALVSAMAGASMTKGRLLTPLAGSWTMRKVSGWTDLVACAPSAGSSGTP